ncbi:MAG TPA: pilus assembly protein TadG-related protein [Pyrinomonadaceae bacterium]
MRAKRLASTRKKERGSILATSAIGMLSILLAVGLGVDISRFYLVKNELQNAADAAALAAVSKLNGKDTGIDKAVIEAQKELNNYDFNKSGVTIETVEFSQQLETGYVPASGAKGQASLIRFAKVTTAESPVGVSFAAMLLGNSKNLSATATAGYSVPLNEICNFLPISVIDYGTPMSPGNTYTFRAAGSAGPSAGNYQLLALLAPGADDVRHGLAAGVDACAGPGAEYAVDTKPGVSAGAVRQGLNTRFDEYQTAALNPADMPPDSNIFEGIDYDEYGDAGGRKKAPSHKGFDNRRVVYIPIIKLEEYDQGRNIVKFNRFGQFFLKTKVGSGSGGELQAEYIDDITLGIGRYNPDGGPAEALLATPVLYK